MGTLSASKQGTQRWTFCEVTSKSMVR